MKTFCNMYHTPNVRKMEKYVYDQKLSVEHTQRVHVKRYFQRFF